jgi:hypothetical protein
MKRRQAKSLTVKTLSQALCVVTLASLLAGQVAFAQPSGLRLDNTNTKGIVLRDTENGLRLRLSSDPVALPVNPWGNESPNAQDGSRNTLRADWPLLDMGIHTSLGLSWDSGRNGVSGKSLGNTSTFVGLGWDSEPSRSSRWALSAQVGTHLGSSNSSGGCKSFLLSCNTAQPLGLSGNAMGNGLRLTPYVSFGATYSFDR